MLLKTDILDIETKMIEKNYKPDTLFVSDLAYHCLVMEPEWNPAEFNQTYVGYFFGMKVYIDANLKEYQAILLDSKNRYIQILDDEFNPSRR